MKIKYLIILFFVSLALTSCYTYHSVGLLQNRKDLPAYPEASYAEYKIHQNDEIVYSLITTDETISKLIASDNAAGSQNPISYRVYSDSTIDLPFVKKIKVGGLTIEEARQVIQARFRELIPDALIRISLANKTFTVIGDIGSGVFPVYHDKLTIYEALALSGDLYNSGDRHNIKIVRPEGERPEILTFDIRTKSVIGSKYYYVYPNDIIYVQREASSFYKVSSVTTFFGLITSSLSLLLIVLNTK